MTSETLDVHHDEEHAWLYLEWKGPQDLPLVQAVCQHVLAFLQHTGVHKVLNDNSRITQTSWELVRWVAYDFLPRAGQAGLQQVAWVQSPLPSCRGHLDLMDDFVGQMPQVALFYDLDAAYAWLSTVPDLPPLVNASQQARQPLRRR